MKNYLKMVALVLLAILLPISTVVVGEQSSEQDELSSIKNDLSVDIYTSIYDALKESEDLYIPDYAGAYIDENGNLIIQFLEGTSYKYNDLISYDSILNVVSSDERLSNFTSKELAGIASSIVRYEERLFSMNELMSLKNAVSDYFSDISIRVALIQKTNSIDISYPDSSYAYRINDFLQSCSFYKNGMVNLEFDEKCIEQPQNSAYPGDRIFYLFSWYSYGTIGFNACYNNQWGVVTNAHVAKAGRTMKCDDGTIGKPAFSTIGGKVDVAFIPYPSGWTETSQLTSSGYDIIYREAYPSEMIEGGTTTKYGVTTGKTRNGYIMSTSVDVAVNYGDLGVITIHDCFQYSNPSQGGDSGGPVGRSATKQVFRLLGIHFASGGYGIKLTNIKEAYPSLAVKTGY